MPDFVDLASLFLWEDPHGTLRPKDIILTCMMETLQAPAGSQLKESSCRHPLERACLRLRRSQASALPMCLAMGQGHYFQLVP